MNTLCILTKDDRCPLTARQVATLNRRFKSGFDKYQPLLQEQAANLAALEAKGLLQDLAHKAAVIDSVNGCAIGQRAWYVLHGEVIAAAQNQAVQPITFDKALRDEFANLNRRMVVKTQAVNNIARQAIVYFHKIDGFDSPAKIDWMLQHCPQENAGDFYGAFRRELARYKVTCACRSRKNKAKQA